MILLARIQNVTSCMETIHNNGYVECYKQFVALILYISVLCVVYGKIVQYFKF